MPEQAPKNERIAALDKNVAKGWTPVASLENRRPGMAFSDRLFYWLVSFAGLVIAACGALAFWLMPMYKVRTGAVLIAIGFGIFAAGGPSHSNRQGYRH